ncbi:MAG: SpoIIE family protein phosphatase [Chloroflexota bacterium]|nr:SpoIIE family protein phosphatase [Chloroflexota bacterium]
MSSGSLTSVVATLFDNSTHGEDSYLIRDMGNGHFLDAVMDGVTGHGGEEASTSVAGALETASISSPEDVIAILEEQNGDFFQVGGGRFLLTTVSVALYLGGPLYIISAGDSPVFHIRGEEHQQLSGRIGGILRMGTAKAIGAGQDLNLHRTEVNLEGGDRLVTASDGVTDNVNPAELAGFVRNSDSPEAASASVKQAINERLERGITPELLGGRFRHDDQTGIFRFF